MSGTGPIFSDIACEGGLIRVVTLNDRERRNALTPSLLSELGQVVSDVNETPDIGALVLTHEGSAFCAGTDISHLYSIIDDRRATRDFLASLVYFFAELEQCEKLTIAAIEGAAVGGGFELALACDLRVLGNDAWVRLPEILLGTIPGGGGVQRLTRFVGRGEASAMVLLGDRVDAQRCEALGLARRVEAGKALESAVELAKLAAARSRVAVAEAKRLIRAAEDLSITELNELAIETMVKTLFCPEGREGIRAMRERRTPDFTSARKSDNA